MSKSSKQAHNSTAVTSSNPLAKLAALQPPATRTLSSNPKTLKYFPLRRTAKLFVVADAIIGSVLLLSRYFIATRIVSFPIFQLTASTFYILISCFGIHQIFSENTASFPFFLVAYPIAIVLNLMATVILGMQTFDMGLITDNCGDVEICYPHVKPIALAGWILVSASIMFLASNVLMMITYWTLSNRVLEEEQYGYYHENYLHLHAHTHSHSSNTSNTSSNNTHHSHQFSHQNYPSNYSKSLPDVEDIEKAHKIRTPQPKRLAKDIFQDANAGNEYVFFSKSDASKLSSNNNLPSASSSVTSTISDYKSLQISPLEINSSQNRNY